MFVFFSPSWPIRGCWFAEWKARKEGWWRQKKRLVSEQRFRDLWSVESKNISLPIVWWWNVTINNSMCTYGTFASVWCGQGLFEDCFRVTAPCCQIIPFLFRFLVQLRLHTVSSHTRLKLISIFSLQSYREGKQEWLLLTPILISSKLLRIINEI